ncbi:DNA polymerase III subunit delta [Spiroplasma endosymbiont of Othius punctulatus]|uniref:DNA polymerase III subunit delta n=1 Tax=Spiroplasma endosymbiont of Othius punctulatus TaxID=3066289 RepID=UPI0030D51F15
MFLIRSYNDSISKKQIHQLLKKMENSETEVYFFDYEDSSINELEEAANTFSLFAERKIIVIKGATFLVGVKKLEIDFERWIDLFKNKSVEFILSVEGEKFNSNKLTKYLLENSRKLEIDKPKRNELVKQINLKLTKNNITFKTEDINYLIDYIGEDAILLNNELNKFITGKIMFNKENIVDLCFKDRENNIFEISNALISNDKTKWINIFNNFIENEGSLMSIVSLLSSNLVATRNVSFLKQMGISNDEIAKQLEMNPYRVSAIVNLKNNNIDLLNDKIKLLFKIQNNILSGKYDGIVIPAISFLKMINNGE